MLVVLCLGFCLVLFAVGTESSVLFVACVLGGLLFYSAVTPWLGMAGTSMRRVVSKECLSPCETTEVQGEWRRHSRWPLPWLELVDCWVHQGTGEMRQIRRLLFPWFRSRVVFTYPLQGLPRGIYRLEKMEAAAGDWFGLMQRRRSFRAEQWLTVYPSPFAAPHSLYSSSGENEALTVKGYRSEEDWTPQLRGYVDGDSYNRIHWKATAKSGELKVRELAESRSEVLELCIDPSNGLEGDSFEWRVSLAAGISFQQWPRCSRIRMVCGQASLQLEPAAADWSQAARWLAALQPSYSGWEDQWLQSICASSPPGHFIYICSTVDELLVRRLKLVRLNRGRTVTLIYAEEPGRTLLNIPWLDGLQAAGIRVLRTQKQRHREEVGTYVPRTGSTTATDRTTADPTTGDPTTGDRTTTGTSFGA
ncbi:DUF58 domain-containing protein [Paenibacillus senegalensis]|uniref:DUF58 domain-containing protein n=1 Tax=Paenibacillus senegalensis TaxID=1465766 RepID=UPI0012FC22F5|nr:DUF58 domain-containing protein [Paenibacillus senegalensis]